MYRLTLDFLLANNSLGLPAGVLAAGAKAAIVVVEYPLTLFKNRLELGEQWAWPSRLTFKALLYRGLLAVVLTEAIFSCCHYAFYQGLVEPASGMERAVLGYVGAALSTVISHPF